MKGAHLQRLNGRVAIVTGAASGIGAATAHRLANEQATVLLTDISDGEPLADSLREMGANAVFMHQDVIRLAAHRLSRCCLK